MIGKTEMILNSQKPYVACMYVCMYVEYWVGNSELDIKEGRMIIFYLFGLYICTIHSSHPVLYVHYMYRYISYLLLLYAGSIIHA